MRKCTISRLSLTRGVLALLSLVAVMLVPVGVADAVRASKAKPPCKPDLISCPPHGCEQPGSAHALLNELKRTRPTAQSAILLQLDDFSALQARADERVGQKVSLTKSMRSKLRALPTLTAGQVSEGGFVAVSGYIVGPPHANKSGESVNCRLPGTANNDFHIPIARAPTDTEFDAIVVEMIPQGRPPGWTIKKLQSIAKKELPVLVQGQLFYDNPHLVNDDPDNVIGGQPKRFSLWEVHPVTDFYACPPDKRCDPRNVPSGWQPLADLQE